jgi:elongation factor P--beta-lysine ligase
MCRSGEKGLRMVFEVNFDAPLLKLYLFSFRSRTKDPEHTDLLVTRAYLHMQKHSHAVQNLYHPLFDQQTESRTPVANIFQMYAGFSRQNELQNVFTSDCRFSTWRVHY